MHVDLGAGDGSFVANLATRDSGTLYIGVEPNHASLVDVSRRRRPRDLLESNVCFVLGSWQDLPGELSGVAARVTVLFPWGSLLQAAAIADDTFVDAIRGIAAPGAQLELVTAIDAVTDAGELRRLGLDGVEPEGIAEAWRSRGLAVEQAQLAASHPYQTTWWRRIRHRPGRVATLTRVTLPGPANRQRSQTSRLR